MSSETIQDLYGSFAEQMEPIQADDRYFRYLFELAQASDTSLQQKREILEKVVDERWISVVEDSLDALNNIIEKPRRFITTVEEVVPVSLAKKISADSVKHLSQNTQFLSPSDDGEVHPTKILNVSSEETYDLYENRFIYHLIQRLLVFVDKRTDVIFWSTGNEIRNHFLMQSKIGDAYEEIEYKVEMTVRNRQSFAENDADNMDVFMRIDRVRRLVMALRNASFCSIMAGCSKVHSPIQRTNLIMKDPDYRKCYELWRFMESYDEVGYMIDVKESEMAIDEEYMVQMYTNLINNYTVFKSLLTDERDLEELETVEHEPIAPKYVKEIKEVVVEDCNIPEVEIRQVFIEEVTQAQLDAEAALAAERESHEQTQEQLGAWRTQAQSLMTERDDLLDEIDMAKTSETMAQNQLQIALAQVEDAELAKLAAEAARKSAEEASHQAEGERNAAEAAREQAEKVAAQTTADAKAAIAHAQSEADQRVEQLQAEHKAAKQQLQEEWEGRMTAARQACDQAVLAAGQDRDTTVAQLEADTAQRLQQMQEDARRQLADAQQAAAAALAEAQQAADGALTQERAAHEAALAKERADHEAAMTQAEDARVQQLAEAESARKQQLADAQQLADGALAKERAAHEAAMAQAQAEAAAEIASLKEQLARSEKARMKAERRAESNSVSRYLLRKWRGEDDVADVAAGGAAKDGAIEGDALTLGDLPGAAASAEDQAQDQTQAETQDQTSASKDA